MDVFEKNLENLLAEVKSAKINIRKLKIIQINETLVWNRRKFYEQNFFIFGAILLFGAAWNHNLFFSEKCAIDMPSEVDKIVRPPENCNFCRGISEVKYLRNLSPDEFEEKYAYKGGGIIVTDAMQNWTAPEVFDYWYFKGLYENHRRKQKTLNCQFFPYKSGLKNLFDAFKMNADRVNYKAGNEPWYFGWSNCNPDIAKILRKHYDRPYFLPKSSENNPTDWIFMGGHGMGAHMHVDNVRLPSWQAQLRGIKEWKLAPPPECYYECNFFSAVVHPGEIIVLDTNKWYHQTNILSGEISVTIGAEYD